MTWAGAGIVAHLIDPVASSEIERFDNFKVIARNPKAVREALERAA